VTVVLAGLDWQLGVVGMALLVAGGYCLRWVWQNLRMLTNPTGVAPGCGGCGGGCGAKGSQGGPAERGFEFAPGVSFVDLDTVRSAADDAAGGTSRPARP